MITIYAYTIMKVSKGHPTLSAPKVSRLYQRHYCQDRERGEK